MAEIQEIETPKLTEELVKTNPKKALEILEWYLSDGYLSPQEISNWKKIRDAINTSNDNELKVFSNKLATLSWELWEPKVEDMLKSRLEPLEKSEHPRAKALLTWVKSSDENQKWYLEKAWKEILLVPDWINILWNTWKLEDETMAEDPKEWIWNSNWYTYFSFDAQKELFWDSVPKKDDWVNLTKFLPWNDKNIVEFLSKVLWLNFAGFRSWSNGVFDIEWVNAAYWSSTSIDSTGAYNMIFNASYISADYYYNRKFGFGVRRFKN